MEAPGTSVGVWLRSCEQLPTPACSGLALKPLGPGTTPSPESRSGVSRSPGEHAVSYSISGCRAPGMSFGLLKTLACGWSFSSWEPRHLWTASWLMVEGSLTSTSQGPAPQAESDPLTDTPASRHPLSKTSCPACFLGHAHSSPAHTQPHPPVWSPVLCLSHRNCLPRSHLSSTAPPAQETSHRVGAGLPASAQRPYLYPGLLRPPARKWGWLPPPVLSSAPHPTPQEPSPASLLGLHVLSAPASVWKLPALWSLPPLPLVIRYSLPYPASASWAGGACDWLCL